MRGIGEVCGGYGEGVWKPLSLAVYGTRMMGQRSIPPTPPGISEEQDELLLVGCDRPHLMNLQEVPNLQLPQEGHTGSPPGTGPDGLQ